MTLLEELKIFLINIAHWVFSFAAFSFFFFFFGLTQVSVFGHTYTLLVPTAQSFSVLVFNAIRQDLLPPGVELITTNPMSAFVSQIVLSMLLSFLLTLPFFMYRIIVYLRPALLPHERKAVLWALLPFVMLFFSGALFAYFFLIPTTFTVLYPYATLIGAVPLFSLDEFINYVVSLMVMSGAVFLLPMFMVFLSVMGIIPPHLWRKNWQQAHLSFLVLSAIITPDGTGVTMAMLFVPLAALYFGGYVFAERLTRNAGVAEKVELVEM